MQLKRETTGTTDTVRLAMQELLRKGVETQATTGDIGVAEVKIEVGEAELLPTTKAKAVTRILGTTPAGAVGAETAVVERATGTKTRTPITVQLMRSGTLAKTVRSQQCCGKL